MKADGQGRKPFHHTSNRDDGRPVAGEFAMWGAVVKVVGQRLDVVDNLFFDLDLTFLFGAQREIDLLFQ
jgi:hypothetical protein